MQTAKTVVTCIPAIVNRFSPNFVGISAKKRVAAYARVSTDNDEQLSSFDAQMDYYTNYINANVLWDLVEVYTDQGISATSTKKRDGFNRMIFDALNGKVDMIITKSVSRFARNTVDTLTTVRQLKEKGVEVYFEKENIFTLDSKGELLITIMSSLAQEESRSISENVTWGLRKRFADGKVSLPYKHFLGFEKGEDGRPKVIEKQAEVVRLIYKLFLEGKAPSSIAKHLTASGVPTPSGKVIWQSSTVESILQNEKYKGSALLQKKFTEDFLTKKKKVNEGEVPQYYVEHSHSAIISSEVFDLAQHEFKKRKSEGRYTTSGGCFSSKVVCGECGSFYGSKVWHSTSKYRKIIWQCNGKFKNADKCKTPHFYEDTLKQAFVGAFNSLIENKGEIITSCGLIIETLTDSTTLDKESIKLQGESDVALNKIQECVDENAHSAIDQAEYQKRYTALVERYETVKRKHSQIIEKRLERAAKREHIKAFLKMLSESDILLTEFDEALWQAAVELVTVHTEHAITFAFKDGTELPWII
jgi:site-specific DNA recombinase